MSEKELEEKKAHCNSLISKKRNVLILTMRRYECCRSFQRSDEVTPELNILSLLILIVERVWKQVSTITPYDSILVPRTRLLKAILEHHSRRFNTSDEFAYMSIDISDLSQRFATKILTYNYLFGV